MFPNMVWFLRLSLNNKHCETKAVTSEFGIKQTSENIFIAKKPLIVTFDHNNYNIQVSYSCVLCPRSNRNNLLARIFVQLLLAMR